MDFNKEEKEAVLELKQVKKDFDRKDKKEKKNITTHVRISPYLKERLRKDAKHSNSSIPKHLNRIITLYFKQNKFYEDEVIQSE
jgi:hypothetical protein